MKPIILIVDDEPVNVRIMAAVLEANDYQVRTAFSGEECLRRVAVEPPDVILLDIMMPGMDGFAVAKQLKQSSETCFIPIVMVTALSDVKARVQALEAGADDFLSKPVEKAELLARVRASAKVARRAPSHATATCSAPPVQGGAPRAAMPHAVRPPNAATAAAPASRPRRLRRRATGSSSSAASRDPKSR